MQVRSIPRPFIRTPRLAGLAAAAWLAAALAGCASSSAPARDWTQQLQRWSDAPIVLLGEQHDAAAHQAWQQATVQQLATQERLAALVIEMAPRTGSTASLARDASEDAVQQALQWQDAAWPWPRYRGVVMAAVPTRIPDVTIGDLSSNGTMFLLMVISALISVFSASRPVRLVATPPFVRKSISIR